MQIYDSKVIQTKLSVAEQQADKISQELQRLQKAGRTDSYMEQQIKTLKNQFPNLKLIIMQLKNSLSLLKNLTKKQTRNILCVAIIIAMTCSLSFDREI